MVRKTCLRCYLSKLQKSRFVTVLTSYQNKSHGATRIDSDSISFIFFLAADVVVPGFYCRGVGRVSQRLQRIQLQQFCSDDGAEAREAHEALKSTASKDRSAAKRA